MYLVVLATIIVFFMVYLAAEVERVQKTPTPQHTQLTQSLSSDYPPTARDNEQLDGDKLYDEMYKALSPTAMQSTPGAPPVTVHPYEQFDTVDGAQNTQATALGTVATAAMLSQKQRPPIDLECDTQPNPCEPEVVWQNSFPGCGTFHIPFESKHYSKDERVWQGDLNPKLQERMALMQKEWDPYQHMKARQAYMQFLSTNMSSKSDKYMQAIDDLDDVDASCITEIQPTFS